MRLPDESLKDSVCVCVCVCVCVTYHSLSYVYFPTDCAPGHFCVFGSNAFPHHPSFWWISCFNPSPLDVWTAVHLLQVCRLVPKGHHSPPCGAPGAPAAWWGPKLPTLWDGHQCDRGPQAALRKEDNLPATWERWPSCGHPRLPGVRKRRKTMGEWV